MIGFETNLELTINVNVRVLDHVPAEDDTRECAGRNETIEIGLFDDNGNRLHWVEDQVDAYTWECLRDDVKRAYGG